MSNDFKGTQENLDSIRGALDALPAEGVRQFNLPVPSAVAMAMKVWKSFKQDEALFFQAFKTVSFNPLDYSDLPARAGGLWRANALLEQAQNPDGSLQIALEKATPLHRKLAKAAHYLWGDDPELGEVVSEIRSGGGHMDKADDLVRYAALFAENWHAAKGRSAVTKADIDDAKDFSAAIIDAMTAVPSSDIAALRDTRDRAGEYLGRAVDHIRAAAAYLFRDDPEAADRYPSLHSGRRRAKKPLEEPPTAALDEETPPSQTPDIA